MRYIGSSTFPPSAIVEAQWVAERRGRERFVCEQPPYSILVRGVEADVLPTCRRYGMGVIPWSPLAGGWLTGRYRKGQDLPESHRAQRIPQRYDMSLPGNQAKLEAADALAQLAEEAGLTPIELALAFVLKHPAVTAPIIGPRTMEQLESQLGAADVTLSDDVLDRIDEIVPPGTNLNATDAGWQNPALSPEARRRDRRRRRSCPAGRGKTDVRPLGRRECVGRRLRADALGAALRARHRQRAGEDDHRHGEGDDEPHDGGQPVGVGDDAQAGGRDPAEPDGQPEAHPGGEAQAAGQVLLAHDDGDREGEDDEEARQRR